MTAFIILAAAMTAAALLWVLVPLMRAVPGDDDGARKERRISGLVVVLALPVLAVVLYARLSDWDWEVAATTPVTDEQTEDALARLRAKLERAPNDIEGWLLLGRSYATLGRFPLAVDAYQRAYDVSQGEHVEAIIGLGEALAYIDEASLGGRAGQLFDSALAKAPTHPKALWYGAVAALRAGDLQRGRDRLQLLLAQNPPEEVRSVLERQIQDLDQQLKEKGGGTEGAAAAPGRSIRVTVSLAPALRAQLSSPLPVFILAREPAGGGPPLAVQQHSSADLPLSVQLSERDAMIAGRSIASVPRVQVVARVSRSGTPQAQSGDFYGEADYEFAKEGSAEGGTLNIIIDRTVP